MVTSTLSQSGNSGNINPSSLMTISQASDYCHCHPQTLRGHVRKGRLTAYRIGPTGWLRFSQDELAQLFGIAVEQKNRQRKKVCILGRVSSDKQADYLKSQIKRLKAHVKEQYGESNPLVFSEVCSAFGNRKALYSCIDAIIDGQVDVLVVEYRDRLSRTSALTNLIKHLCRKYGVTIEYVQKSDNDPTSINASLEELVEFTCHISAKQNGLKAGSRCRINISTATLKRAYELKCQGLGERSILHVLKVEKHKDEQTGKPLTRTIFKYLRENWQVLSCIGSA